MNALVETLATLDDAKRTVRELTAELDLSLERERNLREFLEQAREQHAALKARLDAQQPAVNAGWALYHASREALRSLEYHRADYGVRAELDAALDAWVGLKDAPPWPPLSERCCTVPACDYRPVVET